MRVQQGNYSNDLIKYKVDSYKLARLQWKKEKEKEKEIKGKCEFLNLPEQESNGC